MAELTTDFLQKVEKLKKQVIHENHEKVRDLEKSQLYLQKLLEQSIQNINQITFEIDKGLVFNTVTTSHSLADNFNSNNAYAKNANNSSINS